MKTATPAKTLTVIIADPLALLGLSVVSLAFCVVIPSLLVVPPDFSFTSVFLVASPEVLSDFLVVSMVCGCWCVSVGVWVHDDNKNVSVHTVTESC